MEEEKVDSGGTDSQGFPFLDDLGRKPETRSSDQDM